MAVKRIGMLTGGGDVPGLNAVIKSATYRSSENNIEIVGLRRGWEALTHLNVDDPASRAHYVIQLTRENTRTIDRHGGTVLHTSRTNPAKIRELIEAFSSYGDEANQNSEIVGFLEVEDVPSDRRETC